MLAVWYVDNSSPKNLYFLEIEEDEISLLLSKIDKENMPLPENGEFLFIENDKVVNNVCIFENTVG
jgi:hypothetical protein